MTDAILYIDNDLVLGFWVQAHHRDSENEQNKKRVFLNNFLLNSFQTMFILYTDLAK